MNIRYISIPMMMLSVLLVGCNPEPTTDTTTKDEPKKDIVLEEVQKDDDADHAMMATPELQESCAILKGKSEIEKGDILDDIGQNMDKDALDYILGEKCDFLGPVVEVTALTDADLKLMPNDDEVLYYSPLVNRYFATCSSANTVAYVVFKREAAVENKQYFEDNRVEFSAAASMAQDMMKMMEEEEGMDDDHGGWVDEADKKGEYTTYVDGVVGNGMESVLFFHASWCPKCQANEKKLMSWYDENQYPRSVYKIDYDTADELKKEFNITGQDTFVLIDGNGNEIDRASFPTEAKLQTMIGA